ncbi:MAG: ParB/RepB/Spo0J family partition protein [Planctomycetota bacterium]|jgi:ParB/RepB/Spo0J family partition protein|nr:ParB/RepB/Spo0J family partition protein [Planctomycetota bacterium]
MTKEKRVKRKPPPPPPALPTAGAVVILSVEAIRPSPHNRAVAPDDPSIDDLAASIRERGLLQPIAVRPVRDDRYEYEIVYGERRWLACRRLGRQTIEALVREIDERTAQADRITENLMRRDLTPLEEGDGVAALLSIHAGDVSEVAARLGRSETWVRRRAKLPNLSPAWREELAKPDTGYEHVRDSVERLEDLAILPADVQDELLTDGRVKWRRGAGDFRRTIAQALQRLDQRPWPEEYEDNLPAGQFPSGTTLCSICRERSDRHGDLFAALAEDAGDPAKAFCLNPACWQAKTVAWLKTILEANPDALPVIEDYLSSKEIDELEESLAAPICAGDFGKIKEGDEEKPPPLDAVKCKVVVVHGDGLGEVFLAWAYPPDEKEPSPEERKKRERKRAEERRRDEEARIKRDLKENAFRAAMRRRLPKEIPSTVANFDNGKLLALLCNWGGRLPAQQNLRSEGPFIDVLQALWRCVRDSLTERVIYIHNATPAAERKAICEYCGLDADVVEAAIKEALAKAEAEEKAAKAKKGKKRKAADEDPGEDDGADDEDDEKEEEEEEDNEEEGEEEE